MKEILHILTRVSTNVQENEGYGLDNQLAEGTAVAKMLGFEIKHWDEGAVSSSKDDLSHRPVLTNLLFAVEDGTVEHLYVYRYDRLWRSDAVFSKFKMHLFKAEIKIYTGRNPYPSDLSDSQDKLMLNVMSSFSIYDNELRTERFRLGKLQAIKDGGWKGGPPPYGYKLKNSELVPDELEAEWVKNIFKLYDKGGTHTEIKKMLMDNGVVTRRGNVIWTNGSIDRVLKGNTYYNGHWAFTDGKTGEKVECVCARILDKKLYLRVQKKIQIRSYNSNGLRAKQPNIKTTNLLTGMLFCGDCGSRWNVQNFKNEPNNSNYFCSNKKSINSRTQRASIGKTCNTRRSINLQITDAFVWKSLVDTLSDSSTYKETIKNAALGEKSYTANKSDIKKIRLKLKKLEQQIAAVTDSIIELEIKKRTETDRSEEEVNRIIKGMDERRLDMQLEAEKFKTEIEAGVEGRGWIDWVKKFEKQIDGIRENDWDTEKKKDFVTGFVDRITVSQIDKRLFNILISFKMPFVNDAIKYKEGQVKKGKYDIVSGGDTLELEVDYHGKKYIKINHL